MLHEAQPIAPHPASTELPRFRLAMPSPAVMLLVGVLVAAILVTLLVGLNAAGGGEVGVAGPPSSLDYLSQHNPS